MTLTLFDTDMHIHALSPDPAVAAAAKKEFIEAKSSAMSIFSLLELKGNYIQDLILLRRKIADSNDFASAGSRVLNTGGRKAYLMLAQLLQILGGTDFPVNPWNKAKNKLLTLLDAQISCSWIVFQNRVKVILDDFCCTRAAEEPEELNGKWSASIPRCSKDNTSCNILEFMSQNLSKLSAVTTFLNALDSSEITKELEKICRVSEATIKAGAFPWEGSTCRQVGDLLIALQSLACDELLSSNFKEHSKLNKAIGYTLRTFPLAQIRTK